MIQFIIENFWVLFGTATIFFILGVAMARKVAISLAGDLLQNKEETKKYRHKLRTLSEQKM